MQYIIHIKAYMACFTKVEIMLLKLQFGEIQCEAFTRYMHGQYYSY